MSSSDRDGSNTPISSFRSLSNIHIVVDNSNLFIGAQLGQGKNGKQDYATRINVANLVKILEKDNRKRNIKTRVVGGSLPPRNARVWTEWEKCDYKCLLGQRGNNNKEIFLDDMLHSQIQNLILKNKSNEKDGRQNLILITGDGNINDNRTSFPEVVTLALEHGWTVDVWSWKASLSNKYLDIQRKYPSKFDIHYFDLHRLKITFIQKEKEKEKQMNWNMYLIILILVFLLFFIFAFYF